MPPRAPDRSVVAEEALSRRIQTERERRGWSPAGLASRMTKAGCPMTQSAIWKIENPDKETGRRRRITLDEAFAFSRVFELSLDELTQGSEFRDAEEAGELVRDILNRIGSIGALADDVAALIEKLRSLVQRNDADMPLLLGVMAVAWGDEDSAAALGVNAGDPWSEIRLTAEQAAALRDTTVSAKAREAAEQAIDVFSKWHARWTELAAARAPKGDENGERREEA